jgi:hypothetical protein
MKINENQNEKNQSMKINHVNGILGHLPPCSSFIDPIHKVLNA